MKDNLQLKGTLTRMAAEISKTTLPVRNFHPERDSMSPATMTVSFSIPVIDAEPYLELIQTVFDMRPHAAVTAAAVDPTTKPEPLPSTSSGSVKCERLSDKQNSLINNLVKRKKLAAGQVEDMVHSKFGFSDRALLDKRQASQLIDLLMAM